MRITLTEIAMMVILFIGLAIPVGFIYLIFRVLSS